MFSLLDGTLAKAKVNLRDILNRVTEKTFKNYNPGTTEELCHSPTILHQTPPPPPTHKPSHPSTPTRSHTHSHTDDSENRFKGGRGC